MEHIRKLYENSLSISDSFSLEEFAHITVDRDHVSEEGQIDALWLNQYDVQTWNDFAFKCFFCSERCLSLKKLLEHTKWCKVSGGKIKFGCHSCPIDSRPPFASLNAYINHATRYHELEHLAYTCIDCCKSFYNVAYLIKHISKEHPRHPIIYPCIECGAYCQGLTALKTHIMSHKNQEVSESSDDEEKKPIASSTPKCKEEPFESPSNKRLSMEPQTKRSKVYPCNVCDRVWVEQCFCVFPQFHQIAFFQTSNQARVRLSRLDSRKLEALQVFELLGCLSQQAGEFTNNSDLHFSLKVSFPFLGSG